MESFLNKVEREANEEVKRIHREAQQVYNVLKTLELEIPQELQHLLPPVKITSVKEATEKERKTQDHPKRIAGLKAKAEKDYQETREQIRQVLRKGPKSRDEVLAGLPQYGTYRVTKTATRMRKDGELNYRTEGYQGSTVWFLVERPVTLEQLRDEVVDRKGGDIPLDETKDKLGFQKLDDLLKMLDELVDQGIIRRTEDDTYENYQSQSTSDLRTLHEKKKYTMVGAVPGTGRSRLSSNSEVQTILNKVKSQGAKATLNGSGHILIEYDGKTVTVGNTPSRSGILQDKNRIKSVLGLNV